MGFVEVRLSKFKRIQLIKKNIFRYLKLNKIYPIDIYGVESMGVDEWLNNYYVPVTGKEFYAIYKNVLHAYISILKEYDNEEVYWLAVSQLRLPILISRYILEILRLFRLKEKGYGYILGQKKEKIPEDITTYEFTDPTIKNLIEKRISTLTPQERVKNILRTIKYNILPEYLINKNFFKNISKPYYIIGHRAQQEVVSFCRENEITPIHLPSIIFAKKSPVRMNNDLQYVEMMEFVMKFSTLVRKQHPILGNSTFELLRMNIEECFRDSLFFLRQNIRVFSKYKPKNLLTTGLGNPIHRLFCSAWRCGGGEVIGITHGNSYCFGYTPETNFEISIPTHYITYSRGHEKLVKQVKKDFSYGLRMSEITHFNQSFCYPIFKNLQKRPLVKKVKKIMIVGSVIKSYFVMNTEYHPFARLYNDIQLMKSLKKTGYSTIYKPRPGILTEKKNVFETYADRVLTDSFEDIYNYADCLLFSSPYSSTFGFALLTNKPIVLINVEGYFWHPRVFELIKKRCSVVEAEAVDGKIIFEEKDVVNAVQESINNINYDILNEFAF